MRQETQPIYSVVTAGRQGSKADENFNKQVNSRKDVERKSRAMDDMFRSEHEDGGLKDLDITYAI